MGFPDRNLCLNGIKAAVQMNKSQEIQRYPLSRLLYHFFSKCTVCLWAGSPPFEFPGSGDTNPQVSLNYRTLGLPFNGTVCPEDTCSLAKAFRWRHRKASNHELGAVFLWSSQLPPSSHAEGLLEQVGCWQWWTSAWLVCIIEIHLLCFFFCVHQARRRPDCHSICPGMYASCSSPPCRLCGFLNAVLWP